jgi:hypothetical protein
MDLPEVVRTLPEATQPGAVLELEELLRELPLDGLGLAGEGHIPLRELEEVSEEVGQEVLAQVAKEATAS